MSQLIGVLGVAALAALGSYLLAARRLSGKIGTSEASELWGESRAIRDDYRTRLNHYQDRVLELEKRVARLESVNFELARENAELRVTIARLEAEAIALNARCDEIARKNKALLDEVEQLKAELKVERDS